MVGRISKSSKLKHGVSQGSVLGPVPFLLYINNLTKVKISGNFTIFGDDTTILWNEKDAEHLKNEI